MARPSLRGRLPPAPRQGPTQHRAFGEARAPGQRVARPPQGPPLAPGGRGARSTSYAPRRSHVFLRADTGTPGLGNAAEAPTAQQGAPGSASHAGTERAALLHAPAARRASGTHEGGVSAFERPIPWLGAKHLSDDTAFWYSTPRFDTISNSHFGLARGSRLPSTAALVQVMAARDPTWCPLGVGGQPAQDTLLQR
jgi:hypothetical protein